MFEYLLRASVIQIEHLKYSKGMFDTQLSRFYWN